ncbi:hypothetical protein N0V94_000218 [Neodidymelliopsis sp. IMI 364377]|nr:hypothetical protein N0V94_000218 [Neodidymelliopsis sp. IMI 364377]
MKASVIASSLFLSGAFAFPTIAARAPQQWFTINLANDVSGGNAIRSVVVNSGANKFSTLFANSAVQKNGRIIATSVQNINPIGGNVLCVIQDPSGLIIPTGQVERINDQVTFVDLDGDATKAKETDVSDFTITCEL